MNCPSIKSGTILYDYQLDAVHRMKNGCVLCGGVGSGKSKTALAYYYLQNGGREECLRTNCKFTALHNPKPLYIITTARKRDTLEWEGELLPFHLSPEQVVIDSWNNIKKYTDVTDAFFIFDEQRVVGSGVWVKSFLKIARGNEWVLLSATPGDTWQDYIPVFIANGFYKNRSEFIQQHVIYSRYSKYPKVDRYVNTRRLVRLRDNILVTMEFERKTEAHQIDIYADFDRPLYMDVRKHRWNPFEDRPVVNASDLCYILRRIVNSDESRAVTLLEIFEKHPKLIVFYNFDYELDILRSLFETVRLSNENFELAEWNGHKHQPLPEGDCWAYLVQYTAGAEGWNCIQTDTIVFYSQTYSYKTLHQAMGRIDRLNTLYTNLYYYHIRSRADIDVAISRALRDKKNFNETKFVGTQKLQPL